MTGVDRAIVFSLRYGDSAGIDGNDQVTAAAVRKYPDKFVGFAYVDPRRGDCMELLRHAIEDLKLRGVKYGPIYNGVHLNDPRMEPIYRYCVKHDLPLTMHMGTTFVRNAPVGVAAGIIRSGDDILLVEQKSDGRQYWSLPGGVVEPNETAVQGLLREVAEETGVCITDIGRIAHVTEIRSQDLQSVVIATVFEVAQWDA